MRVIPIDYRANTRLTAGAAREHIARRAAGAHSTRVAARAAGDAAMLVWVASEAAAVSTLLGGRGVAKFWVFWGRFWGAAARYSVSHTPKEDFET